MSSKPANGAGGEKKRRVTKLEKISELSAANKQLREEQRRLQKQLATQQGASGSSVHVESTEESLNNEQKYLEAIKALNRVSIKQEQILGRIQRKAKEHGKLLRQRARQMKHLEAELDALQEEAKGRRTSGAGDDLDSLRTEVEDLQLNASQLEHQNKLLTLQLEASNDKTRNLTKQLDSARGLMERDKSSRSLKSSESNSVSEFDLARMRKELASKIERIVMLEFDLELCREELHELKQRHLMGPTSHDDGEEGGDFPVLAEVGGSGFISGDDMDDFDDDDWKSHSDPESGDDLW